MDYPCANNAYYSPHIKWLRQSFKRVVGRNLMSAQADDEAFAEALFYAPFAVLSHDNNHDPLFNYANLSALKAFGYEWHELMGLPSRLSAEAGIQADREKSLAIVKATDFLEHYQGVRITKTGRRFLIKNTVIWNVYDNHQNPIGQAACFDAGEFL